MGREIVQHWDADELLTVITFGDDGCESAGRLGYPDEEPLIQYELTNFNSESHEEFLYEFIVLQLHELTHWANEDMPPYDEVHSLSWEVFLDESVIGPVYRD